MHKSGNPPSIIQYFNRGYFLKPISLAKYNRKDAKNEKFLIEVTQTIRFRIQATIHKELVSRGIFKF